MSAVSELLTSLSEKEQAIEPLPQKWWERLLRRPKQWPKMRYDAEASHEWLERMREELEAGRMSALSFPGSKPLPPILNVLATFPETNRYRGQLCGVDLYENVALKSGVRVFERKG